MEPAIRTEQGERKEGQKGKGEREEETGRHTQTEIDKRERESIRIVRGLYNRMRRGQGCL